MPGSIYWPSCERCGATFEIHTGGGFDDGAGRHWDYRQMVCKRSHDIHSVRSFDGQLERDTCPDCEAPLEPWAGRVWHERSREGMVGRERVEGPCPHCGAAIHELSGVTDKVRIGEWD